MAAEFKPGQWAYGVVCVHCKRKTPILPDETGGTIKPNWIDMRLNANCTWCGERHVYSEHDVIQFQVGES